MTKNQLSVHETRERQIKALTKKLDAADPYVRDAAIKRSLHAISYDDAWRVIMAYYWDDVRSVDTEIRRMVKDGELTEESELYDAIHEACENTQRVIYTHQAKVGLCCTNNADAYEEEIGEKPPTVEAQMCMALIADVTARLDDIEWPGDEAEEE